MKFSLILPVYNVEKYIKKCLESIQNQTYNNYEVIIVDDGSLDSSADIINKYIKGKKSFSYYKKINGGLSDARNYGAKLAKGDYLLFIDSDDYIEKELLARINQKLKNTIYDIVRFGVKIVDEDGHEIKETINVCCDESDKYTIMKNIISNEFIEAAWLYAYNKKFWFANNFLYPKGAIHEDYGLTPLILSKAKTIGIIDYSGYNYVQRKNSIMHQMDYAKLKKRTMDYKNHFEFHRKNIIPDGKINRLILGFSAEALIYKSKELRGEDFDNFVKYLQKEKVVKQIYAFTLKKKILKLYLSLFLKQRLKKLQIAYLNELGESQ